MQKMDQGQLRPQDLYRRRLGDTPVDRTPQAAPRVLDRRLDAGIGRGQQQGEQGEQQPGQERGKQQWRRRGDAERPQHGRCQLSGAIRRCCRLGHSSNVYNVYNRRCVFGLSSGVSGGKTGAARVFSVGCVITFFFCKALGRAWISAGREAGRRRFRYLRMGMCCTYDSLLHNSQHCIGSAAVSNSRHNRLHLTRTSGHDSIVCVLADNGVLACPDGVDVMKRQVLPASVGYPHPQYVQYSNFMMMSPVLLIPRFTQ